MELARGQVREELDKKKDRGAGKVVNFCLSFDTKVLTDSGYKLIHNVTKKDLLWDGRGWCNHAGVQFRHKMLCIRRGNLRCTPDHIVYEYTDHDTIRPVCAIDACADKFINLAVMTDTDSKPVPEVIDKVVEPITPEVLARRQWLRDGYNMVNENRPESELTASEIQHIREYDNLIAEEIKANRCSYVSAYDIIDVGEYNRFYADGGLVHNSSSYGGQAASLQRKIEADTGNKPELDDVQAMLDAIERRQPRATQFFKELESVPTEKGYIRAASGRLRHCHTLASGIKGLSSRTREGQLTALGRECRNFP